MLVKISITFLVFLEIVSLILAGPMKSVGGGSKNSVDESLYSRQLFVYGKNAQQKLQNSHVLVRGNRFN